MSDKWPGMRETDIKQSKRAVQLVYLEKKNAKLVNGGSTTLHKTADRLSVQ